MHFSLSMIYKDQSVSIYPQFGDGKCYTCTNVWEPVLITCLLTDVARLNKFFQLLVSSPTSFSDY